MALSDSGREFVDRSLYWFIWDLHGLTTSKPPKVGGTTQAAGGCQGTKIVGSLDRRAAEGWDHSSGCQEGPRGCYARAGEVWVWGFGFGEEAVGVRVLILGLCWFLIRGNLVKSCGDSVF